MVMLNEGNKRDEYLEKKGEESTKTTAMRKSRERRGHFSAGDTHQDTERENITWVRPGTRPHADSLDRQRKGAHRMSKGRKKPQAGSSPEDRRWDAFVGDENKGKYQKLQDKKKKGQPTNIEAQKQGLLRKGEKRRQLRTQAVDAIRRAMGGGHVSEAKVDDRLSADQKAIIRNRRLPPGERLPVRGETARDTEERLTQTRRERTARNRGGQTVRGSRGLEPWGVTTRKKYYPEKISARRDELRAKRAKNNIRSFKEGKTFEEFMIEARERAHKFPLSKDERETVQRIRDQLYGKKSSEPSERENSSTKSASRRKSRRLEFEVREENNLTEMPYQIYGPDPHGASDSEPRPLGKPYKNKKRAKTRADKLDQEIGGYRHFVRKVDEEFKDLTPEKEERVKNRMGELFRDVQVNDARMKELRNKPFGKYRPKVKKKKEAIVKSSKKKQKLVQNASDALIRTQAGRNARTLRRIEDIKQQLRDFGENP